ncbi:uncharacterized protein LOC123318048 isoform X2 [Coccinella septempunctata]|uniref:uncharacterized protein LOC123318048 isoform X2 n=1 Tax=Coccinella septempunctata TaxID=41139 RepID=UPI001D074AF1|nr:uncharacterized protein LOC123318048 isoform X2 [Coccinella septempunctata]
MLPKIFQKGVLWLKFTYVYPEAPTEILSYYFGTYKHHEHSIDKLHIEISNMNSKAEDEILEKNKIDLDKNETNQLPQEPTTCCMSGCANCVWLEYAEKMSEYFKDGGESAIKEINERVNDANIRAFLLQELRMRKL